jgi:endonuclease/exonuclease/phosphatase family metal-dependent hydrolase
MAADDSPRPGTEREKLGELKPDILALNEICVPQQTGRWLQEVAKERFGIRYALLQQSKTAASEVEAEGILTRCPVLEASNLDLRARDSVVLAARLEVEGREIEFYVTHLYRSRGEDSLRQYQVQELLHWMRTRGDVEFTVACGDFNATLDMPSGRLMASVFRPTQTAPTAFTPLQEAGGTL